MCVFLYRHNQEKDIHFAKSCNILRICRYVGGWRIFASTVQLFSGGIFTAEDRTCRNMIDKWFILFVTWYLWWENTIPPPLVPPLPPLSDLLGVFKTQPIGHCWSSNSAMETQNINWCICLVFSFCMHIALSERKKAEKISITKVVYCTYM